MQAERNVGLLRQELGAVESAILKEAGPDEETGLYGMVLLYIGGRAGPVWCCFRSTASATTSHLT